MARIELQNATVDYPIFHSGSMSLRNTLVSAGTGGAISRGVNNIVTVRAIDNVTLTIQNGDRVGLIGHNGSGKSTLLRTMAGINSPSSGKVVIDGSVSAILQLGAGLDRELSGYENIVRMGMILGATGPEARSLVPDIEDFTELGNFLAVPVHTYSAGMLTRLSFAIATAMRPDILLIDEILGAGDSEFQQKARIRIESLMEKASILVLASHSEELTSLYCSRILQFENGKIVNDK